MAKHGYAGEILKVDLPDGKITRLPTSDYTDRFLGGRGMAVKLYWDMVSPQTNAFDPENCFICATGPVAGFTGFAGGRWQVCGKSLTGEGEAFSYGNLGGRWGIWLKYAGYDGLVIQGKADKPVYLFINDGNVEIRDASHLWGRSSFEVHDTLQAELGDKVSVLTIGPAAENLVSFATVFADEEASGSGGLGAVMGSKMLKAIAVTGNKKPSAADPARLRQIADRIREIGRKAPASIWGVPGITSKRICFGCGMGCDRQMYTGEDGRLYKHFCQPTDLYQRPAMEYFGEWNEVQMLAIRLCDGYGIDTAVIKGLILWLIDCYREGLLHEEDTGLPLSVAGSAEFIEVLTKKIAHREGFGDTLARGTIAAAESVGQRAREILGNSIATRANETKDYDPRLMMTTALLYATEPRRPIQQLHDVVAPLMFWLSWVRKEENAYFTTDDLLDAAVKFWGSEIASNFSTYEGKALAAKIIQDRTYAKESLILCDMRWPMNLAYYPGGYFAETTLQSQIFSAITGKETDEAGLNMVGERIFNLQRAIQLRHGWNPIKDDVPLDYFFEQPLKEGEMFFDIDCLAPGKDGEVISKVGAILDREAFEKMKREYYKLRGWDVESGLPTRARLEELALGDISRDLEDRGLLK